jgi:hypothetical protein
VKVIPYRSGDADAARWTLSLESGGYIHHVAVNICAIRNYITYINPDAKLDRPVGGLVAIMVRHLLLNFYSTANCTIDAVENDEKRITTGIDDPTSMLGDGWNYQRVAESTEPFKCAEVIHPY